MSFKTAPADMQQPVYDVQATVQATPPQAMPPQAPGGMAPQQVSSSLLRKRKPPPSPDAAARPLTPRDRR